MYYITSPILQFDSADSVHELAITLPCSHIPQSCKQLWLSIVHSIYYGITVFIVVHYWNQPVLAPRNTKYFIIGSAVVWLLAIAAGIPSLVDVTVNEFCSRNNSNVTSDTGNTSSHFTLSSALFLVVCILPIIACYSKLSLSR